MNRGAGFFWLLAVVLFGGAAYFAFHVVRMKAELATPRGPEAEASAPSSEGAEP